VAHPDPVHFGILGPLQVSRGVDPIDIGGPKPRAALGLLLLRANCPVLREALIDAVWRDWPPPSANNTLQGYISHLRKALEPDRGPAEPSSLLPAAGRGYVLRVRPEQVDAHRFEQLAAEARGALARGDASFAVATLDQALKLWRAAALEDLAAEPFALQERVRLDELRLAATEDWLEAGLMLGRHNQLIPEMNKVLADHPLLERVWGQLMLALYRAGRQGDALRCYQRARHALVEELGIEPSHALQQLEAAILAHDPVLDLWPSNGESATGPREPSAFLLPGATSVAAPSEVLADVFVGRERELIDLHVSWEGARAGRGRVVFITGEAGIGKSRLAREFSGLATARGDTVLWGRSWHGEGAPAFWPWTQVVRAWAARTEPEQIRAAVGVDGSYLSQVFPDLDDRPTGRPPDRTADPEQGRFALFDSLDAVFRRIAQQTPVVVILEDLQAADPVSLRFLEFLCQGIDDVPILVVATIREGQLPPNPDLRRTVADLSRGHGCRRLALRGFSQDEVGRYVAAASPVAPADGVLPELHRVTAGNPFFVTEMVRLAAAEGRLGDRCHRSHDERLPVPAAVRDVIRHRLSLLSGEANRVLTLAAVIGDEFDFEVLERLGDIDGETILDALDEAVRALVICESPPDPGRYSFCHALFRETLEGDLTGSRRALTHRQVAEALESLAADGPARSIGPLAHHLLEGASASDTGKAVDCAMGAARASAARFAFEEAVGLLTRARRTLDRFLDGDQPRRAALLLALGEAENRMGHLDEAKAANLEAMASARRAGDTEQLGLAAVGYSAVMGPAVDTEGRGLELLEEALLALARADSPARALVLSRLAKWRYYAGRSADGRSASREAIEMALRIGEAPLVDTVLGNVHWALYGPDHIRERLALSTEVLAIGEYRGDPALIAQGQEWRLCDLLQLGEMEQADEAALLLFRAAKEIRSERYLWYAAAHQAMCACVEGRFDEAERLAAVALEVGRHLPGRHPTRLRYRREDRPAEVAYEMQLFVVRLLQGRIGELVPTFEALVAAERSNDGWLIALALLYADEGRESDTRQLFEEIVDGGFENIRRNVEWLPKMATLATVCAFLGDADRAGRLYELLVPYEARNATILELAFFGSASHVLGLLAATMWRWRAAELHFQAAIERHERMQSPSWVALSKHALAKMLLERGDPGDQDRVAELTGDVLATARRLGMAALESRVLALRAYSTSRSGWTDPDDRPTHGARSAALATTGAGAD